MAGNSPGSGFKATMTNELLIGEIKKVAKHDPALAQWLSAAVGGVVNKVSGESSNSGAATASYATKWNEYVVQMYGIYHAPIAEDYQLGTEEQKQIAEQYGRYIMVTSMESEADTLLPPRDWPKEENQLVVKAAGISPWDIPVSFNHAYGVDYQGNKYLIQGADIGVGTFPVHITKSTVTYKWGSFTGVSAYANIGVLGGTGASISKDSFSTNSSISTTGMAVVGIETAIELPKSDDFRYGVNEARGIDFKYYNIYQPGGLFTNPNNNNEESSEERID
jgi:putative septum site-determining protein minC